jgi:hypothetical protein
MPRRVRMAANERARAMNARWTRDEVETAGPRRKRFKLGSQDREFPTVLFSSRALRRIRSASPINGLSADRRSPCRSHGAI